MQRFFIICCMCLAALHAESDTLADVSLRGCVQEVEEASVAAGPGSGEYLAGRRMVFDEKGSLLRDEWAGPSGEYATVTVYTYDDGGRLAEKVFTQPGMSVPDRTVYDWANGGGYGPSEIVHTFTVGTYGWIYRVRYDEAGRLEEKRKYELAGTPVSVLRRAYDKDGRVDEEVLLGPGGTILSRLRYEYRANTVVRRADSGDGTAPTVRTTVFNEHGDPSVVRIELSSGKVLSVKTFAYVYDSRGNWTERVEAVGGETGRIVTRRTIRYGTCETDTQGEDE